MFGTCEFDFKKKLTSYAKYNFLFDEGRWSDEKKRTEHRYDASVGSHGVSKSII